MKRICVLAVSLLLSTASLSVVGPAASAMAAHPAGIVGVVRPVSAVTPSSVSVVMSSRVVRPRLRAAIRHLRVARETRRGYARAKFRHWVDADHDCRDTRDEVLAQESRVRARGCDVRRGRWFSYYDHTRFRWSSRLDIDHMVPLAEAWDSGARRWNARTRTRYANDLGDRRSLVAVSASSNRSKSDRDPAGWLPRYGKCRYVREWVAVKTRWHLRVNRVEKRVLLRRASRCRNRVLTVRRAKVGLRTSGGTSSGGGGLDPRFGTCAEAKSHGYGPYHRSRDGEYSWYRDADSDGVVCE